MFLSHSAAASALAVLPVVHSAQGAADKTEGESAAGRFQAGGLAFDKDIPFMKNGIGLDQVWFSGGRTAVTLLRHGGLGTVLHYGRQGVACHEFFRTPSPLSSWGKLFRLCVMIDGVAYYPEFNDTRLYPFGYTSTCTLAGVTFRHALTVLNDAVTQEVRVLSNPHGRKLSLKLFFHGCAAVGSAHRRWGDWEMDEALGGLRTVAVDAFTEDECRRQVEEKQAEKRVNFPVADVARGETQIGFASNLKSVLTVTNQGFKYYLATEDFTDAAAALLVFAPNADRLRHRMRDLAAGYAAEGKALVAAYRQRLAGSPQIRIEGQAAVQSFLVNLPAVIDSLEARDVPGGFRAATHGYWIWIDLFFNASAFTYSNDSASLLDMLKLFRSFADPKLGIPKLVTTTLQPLLGSEWVEQCLYICAFYHYYCNTGDREALREAFPFMAWILEKCREKEVSGSGLIEGIGMPDFPMDMDGHDLCSSGNSIFYQALKAMAALTRELDADTQERAKEYAALAARCRGSFLRHFYDPDQGYFVDSVSSRDFSKRRHYPVFAILWITHFAADLLGDHAKEIAAFQAKNFTRPHGIGGMIPTWDSGYPADGNQLLSYYPSWSEAFYRNTMRLAGRADRLDKWFEDVEWFWRQNTIPEGFTYDAENEGFTVDNPGTKQAFAGQAWYCVFFGAVVGVVIDEQGLVISPSPSRKKITVEGLVVRGKRLDIMLTGKGTGILFNGKKLAGATVRIPFADLETKNSIVMC